MARRDGERITSTMQDDFPLTITTILNHGSRVYGQSECVTWQGDHARHTSYREIEANARRLAQALIRLGVTDGEPVATFCWNNQEHLEAYYAIPCMGAVVHTLNIRLPAHQLTHIVTDAADKIMIVDGSLLPLLGPVAPSLTSVEAFIVIGDGDASALGDRPVYRYAELLAAEDGEYTWPELDERSAAAMCYTSGTTGDPRGVVYSHRSTFLHALATLTNACTGASEADRQLTIVPMFHVNAWGMPYAAALTGASLVLPGRHLDGASMAAVLNNERV
ncbi:MAG TPA: AMP-binding protein, partial [Streptosporangiaceae bacterium]